MGYFDEIQNVETYIKLSAHYNGVFLIKKMMEYLKSGSSVLELGMGPGKDLNLLSESFQATGSDLSQVFLDLYRKDHKETELLLLDARTLNTKLTFDGIYSNKVLIHLTKKELRQSLKRQRELLTEHGIILHSFWKGNSKDYHKGLLFQYYTKEELKIIIQEYFNILVLDYYTEDEKDDSIFVIGRK